MSAPPPRVSCCASSRASASTSDGGDDGGGDVDDDGGGHRSITDAGAGAFLSLENLAFDGGGRVSPSARALYVDDDDDEDGGGGGGARFFRHALVQPPDAGGGGGDGGEYVLVHSVCLDHLREAQVVELARGEVHRTLLRYADGGVLEQRRAPRGAVAERRRDRDPHFRRSAPRSR